MSNSNQGQGTRELSSISVPDLRKGLGEIFILSGVLHWALMIYATLYALGKLTRTIVTVSQWNSYYLDHFLWTFLCAILYIVQKAFKTGPYAIQLMVDFMLGVTVFYGLFRGVRFILARGLFTPWLSLLPGLFLLYYGCRLYRGRQIWSGLDLF